MDELRDVWPGLALVGIVKKNGDPVLNLTNQHRGERGCLCSQAIIAGQPHHGFSPILMTTAMLVAAMVPDRPSAEGPEPEANRVRPR